MTTIKRFAVGLLCSLGLQGAWAQLVTYGSTFGDDSLIVDSRTGLTWLRLDLSADLQDSETFSQLGNAVTFESGVYAGYRVATQAEVSTLIQSYVSCTTPDLCFPFSSVGSNDPVIASYAMEFTQLFGAEPMTLSDGRLYSVISGYACSGGCDGSPDMIQPRGINLYWWVGPAGSHTNSDRFASPNGMTYMVAAVPEPSTYALMLAGLAAVSFVARRRNASAAKNPLI